MPVAILLDSNILLRLARRDDPQFKLAADALHELRGAQQLPIITPQVEREFWAVATRPRQNNGLGMTPEEAAQQLTTFKTSFAFKADTLQVHERWRELVLTFRVSGKETHDAGMVAAMRAHGITEILTFDEADFTRYGAMITIRTPQSVVAEGTTKPRQ